MSETNGDIHFLLVEDDDGHAELVQVLIASVNDRITLHRVSDGVEAISFLRRQAPYVDAQRPDVILLDLKLPRQNGHEVLGLVKNDPELCTIPVVVLTTSCNEQDRRRAYELHANSFLSKPLDFDSIEQMLRNMTQYWSKWNLPAHSHGETDQTGSSPSADAA